MSISCLCLNGVLNGIMGLSVNILYKGDKLPIQRSFFTYSMGNLLPALGLLNQLYNLCNFVIIFL